MNTTINKNFIRPKLKEYIKTFKQELREESIDNAILTPKIAYRLLYTNNALVDIFTPKVVRNGPRTFIYKNHTRSIRASEEIISEAKKNWRPALSYMHENVWRFSDGVTDYEFATDIIYIFNHETNPYINNCYLEEQKLEDIVSTDTFDTFKDLYSFSKI
jgi:hypothetical protein